MREERLICFPDPRGCLGARLREWTHRPGATFLSSSQRTFRRMYQPPPASCRKPLRPETVKLAGATKWRAH